MKSHLSDKAYIFVLELLEEYPTKIQIKKERSTKHGDFRVVKKEYLISINNSLSHDAFLFVTLHEIAHRINFQKGGRKVQPHGDEWKSIFSDLLFQALDNNLFDQGLEQHIASFAIKPTSVVGQNHQLHRLLFPSKHNGPVVDELELNALFLFKKRIFKKMGKRRTRVLCEEIKSQKKYLFHKDTPVTIATE